MAQEGHPFGYTGRRWFTDLGLYYYRARWYDPELGTFLETDPIGQLDYINLYSYVGLNPLNATDPSGMTCIKTDSGSTLCEFDEVHLGGYIGETNDVRNAQLAYTRAVLQTGQGYRVTSVSIGNGAEGTFDSESVYETLFNAYVVYEGRQEKQGDGSYNAEFVSEGGPSSRDKITVYSSGVRGNSIDYMATTFVHEGMHADPQDIMWAVWFRKGVDGKPNITEKERDGPWPHTEEYRRAAACLLGTKKCK